MTKLLTPCTLPAKSMSLLSIASLGESAETKLLYFPLSVFLPSQDASLGMSSLAHQLWHI